MNCRLTGILFFFLLNFFNAQTLLGQVVSEFPIQAGQYFILQSSTNPATACVFGKTEAFVANYSNLGAFNNIRTLSFLFNQKLGNKSKFHYHTAGLYALSDKEGEFLKRNRFYPSYSYHIRLNSKYYFSTGTSIGFATLTAEGTPTTAGGSDIAPDGNLGISIHSENFILSLSSNQLFNSKLKPIRQQIELKRHYTIFIKKTFALSPHLNFLPIAQLRYPSYPFNYDLDLTGLIEIQGIVQAGITYKYKSRFMVNLGLDLPVLRNNHLLVYFTYHTATFFQNSTLQALEFNVGYLLK